MDEGSEADASSVVKWVVIDINRDAQVAQAVILPCRPEVYHRS